MYVPYSSLKMEYNTLKHVGEYVKYIVILTYICFKLVFLKGNNRSTMLPLRQTVLEKSAKK